MRASWNKYDQGNLTMKGYDLLAEIRVITYDSSKSSFLQIAVLPEAFRVASGHICTQIFSRIQIENQKEMENMDTQFTTLATQNVTPRKLYMDFDLYTEGDTAFKKELLTLIIKNIHDFQKALADVFIHKTPEIFQREAHKVKVSISMLNDPELSETLKGIQRDIVANSGLEYSRGLCKDFDNICDGIVASLVIELNK